MPVPNLGLQITRDRVPGINARTAVDSEGVGSDNLAEAAANTKLAFTAAKNSYWKSGASVTITSGGDGTADPWWQIEATFAEAEANEVLFEMGTSTGTLTGTNPAGNDGTKLYTRKRIGGATGIGKDNTIQLLVRTKVTY